MHVLLSVLRMFTDVYDLYTIYGFVCLRICMFVCCLWAVDSDRRLIILGTFMDFIICLHTFIYGCCFFICFIAIVVRSTIITTIIIAIASTIY